MSSSLLDAILPRSTQLLPDLSDIPTTSTQLLSNARANMAWSARLLSDAFMASTQLPVIPDIRRPWSINHQRTISSEQNETDSPFNDTISTIPYKHQMERRSSNMSAKKRRFVRIYNPSSSSSSSETECEGSDTDYEFN